MFSAVSGAKFLKNREDSKRLFCCCVGITANGAKEIEFLGREPDPHIRGKHDFAVKAGSDIGFLRMNLYFRGCVALRKLREIPVFALGIRNDKAGKCCA